METQKVKTCFTITFTHDQFNHAKEYVDDMKKHPQRVFWRGKEGKTDDELIVEQIAHRILSGFYNTDAYRASKHIVKMESLSMTR
jgi:tripartite-type tricarboxylate transporter receptor subunit TctC